MTEEKTSINSIDIGIIGIANQFKLCEMLITDPDFKYFPEYVSLQKTCCLARLKRCPDNILDNETITFEKIDSIIATIYLRSVNVLYVDDDDLLRKLVNILPHNITTIIFGAGIKNQVYIKLPDTIKNVISFTNFIYYNIFKSSSCILFTNDIISTANFIRNDFLTADNIIVYDNCDISNKTINIDIPENTKKFIYYNKYSRSNI